MSAESAQRPFRVKGQTTCMYHHGTALIMYCETCKDLGCLKCLNSVHRNHVLCDIESHIPGKKRRLQMYINDTEKKELTEIQQKLNFAEEKLEKNLGYYGDLITEVTQQGDKLKQEMDNLVATITSLYKALEVENAAELHQYSEELQKSLKGVTKHLEECKDHLQNRSNIEVFDYDIPCSTQFPVEPSMRSVKFTPNRYYYGLLEKALGTFESIHLQNQTESSSWEFMDWEKSLSLGRPKSLSSPPSYPQIPSTSEQRNHSNTTRLSRSRDEPALLMTRCQPQAKTLAEFTAPFPVGAICPDDSGKAWLCNLDGKVVTLLNRKGKVISWKQPILKIGAISISRKTGNIWTCSMDDCNIREYMSAIPALRFHTPVKPLSLCVASDDNVLVGMDQKITKFTANGTVILSTRPADSGRRALVITPMKISECSVSQNVATMDLNLSKSAVGNSQSRVMVMDKNLQELFWFGESIGEDPLALFDPKDVKFDNSGQLVIADSHFIHVVNGNGQYLRLIHTVAEACTRAIGLDTDNVLWLVSSVHTVQVLRYGKKRTKCSIS